MGFELFSFFDRWGGNFCLFIGIGYQYLGKKGKKVLYLVLLSFLEICLI